uniref:Uncharacterized protein n=1 Tax=Arundo donax TaxID=35708 RepID=A0A0A9DP85_ARUDO
MWMMKHSHVPWCVPYLQYRRILEFFLFQVIFRTHFWLFTIWSSNPLVCMLMSCMSFLFRWRLELLGEYVGFK